MRFRDIPQDVVAYRLPRPPQPTITSTGFSICPACFVQGWTSAQLAANLSIYQLAFAQAQIDTRPSLPERDLAGVWN
jgi:hypothetical protein